MKIMTVFVLSLIVLMGCGTKFDEKNSIHVYTRDEESGTREAFFERIKLDSKKTNVEQLKEGYAEVTSNSDMTTKIKNDSYGIGYISLSSLEDSGLLGLQYNGVTASVKTALDGTYQLTRPFVYILRQAHNPNEALLEGNNADKIADAFTKYMSTQEGKSIIKSKGGIVSVTKSDVKWSDVKTNYAICSKDNSKVNVKFGGSTSVITIVAGLQAAFKQECGSFNAVSYHAGSGDAYKATQGSSKNDINADAGNFNIGFLSRNLKGLPDVEGNAIQNSYGQFSLDAVVAVINSENNSITNATPDLLKDIFTGNKKTWIDLK